MPTLSERRIVFLVGAVQFVNILDFMIVMPLGPDFASALQIPAAHLGYIGGSYTAAAAVSGFAGSFFLDRFDRRKALAVSMLGLVIGTLMGAFATGMTTLMLARVIAGTFGGPATSVALSIIADVVPPERRGRALGAVMGAFSVASILGVPAGLELARQGGWRLPFIAVAVLGFVVTAAAIFMFPPLRLHLEGPRRTPPTLGNMLARPIVRWSYVMTAVVMFGGFMLIPNLSAYLQFNLGYPRSHLGLLYLAGGAVSFFGLRVIGELVDRFGSFTIGTIGSAALVVLNYLWFVNPPAGLPIMAIFVTYMLCMSFRNVPYNTLATKVPQASERARFMSIQSSIQHLASAGGAFLGASLLTERPDKSLEGVPGVAWVTITLAALVPLLLYTVEKLLRVNASAGAESRTPSVS